MYYRVMFHHKVGGGGGAGVLQNDVSPHGRGGCITV